jgi:acetyltransferase-like isoleucine patch superfamily enzyme
MEDRIEPFRYLGAEVTIYPWAKILAPQAISIGSHVIIDDFVFIGVHRELIIGNYIHIATHASITGGGRCVIGDFCGLASGVRILTGTDSYLGEALVGSSIPPEFRKVKRGEVILESHVLLGLNAAILPDVHLGEGAVVIPGSLVNHDLEPWGVYGGIPARRIKTRPRETVLEMEQQVYEKYGRPPRSFRSP